MGKDGESVKISCFTLLWFSKQFKQIELTSKSIYIIVGLFTSSRDNISFNHEQFLKKSQAVALVVLKCSKVYLPHLTQKTIYFFYFFYIYIYIYISLSTRKQVYILTATLSFHNGFNFIVHFFCTTLPTRTGKQMILNRTFEGKKLKTLKN